MSVNISKLKRTLVQNAINIPGFRTKRKILVIESDDWGSIRMPSKQVYYKFIEEGFKIHESVYNRLDTLECNEDLELLFEVLQSNVDSKGNAAVITANIVVGNPDFDKIKEANFQNYHYESVEQTMDKYASRDKVISFMATRK